MVPRTSGKVFELTGHQIDNGVVLVAIGSETQREVTRNGAVLAEFVHAQIALTDRVEKSAGMVQMTRHFVTQTSRIIGGFQIEVVAVFTRTDDVQFPKKEKRAL